MLINGKGDGKVSLHRINLWQRQQSVAKDLTVITECDGDTETKTDTASTSLSIQTVTPVNTGHRVSVRLQNYNPDEPFEVEGFQLMLREASTR
jgi:hypothetical protein